MAEQASLLTAPSSRSVLPLVTVFLGPGDASNLATTCKALQRALCSPDFWGFRFDHFRVSHLCRAPRQHASLHAWQDLLTVRSVEAAVDAFSRVFLATYRADSPAQGTVPQSPGATQRSTNALESLAEEAIFLLTVVQQFQGAAGGHTAVPAPRAPLGEVEHWVAQRAATAQMCELVSSPATRSLVEEMRLHGAQSGGEELQALIGRLTPLLDALPRWRAEAEWNAKYLGILRTPFQHLASSPLPAVAVSLPGAVNTLGMISSLSRHYSSRQRMEPLLASVGDALAMRVASEVSAETALSADADTRTRAMEHMRAADALLARWIRAVTEPPVSGARGGLGAVMASYRARVTCSSEPSAGAEPSHSVLRRPQTARGVAPLQRALAGGSGPEDEPAATDWHRFDRSRVAGAVLSARTALQGLRDVARAMGVIRETHGREDEAEARLRTVVDGLVDGLRDAQVFASIPGASVRGDVLALERAHEVLLVARRELESFATDAVELAGLHSRGLPRSTASPRRK